MNQVIKSISNPAVPEADSLTSLISAGNLNKEGISGVFDFGKKRNRVIKFEYKGKKYVVKYFHKNGFPGKLFSLLGKDSKAKKSYLNSLILEEAGFGVARPISYWEIREMGFVKECGYLSELVSLPLVSLIYDSNQPIEMRRKVMMDLSRYTYRLHMAGFLPKDFNISNILVDPADDNGESKFWLIDINRFRKGRIPDIKEAMLSFDQLGIGDDEYPYALAPYAGLRNWNESECIKWIEHYRQRHSSIMKIKNLFRRSKN